jgi:hypothetical protein
LHDNGRLQIAFVSMVASYMLEAVYNGTNKCGEQENRKYDYNPGQSDSVDRCASIYFDEDTQRCNSCNDND